MLGLKLKIPLSLRPYNTKQTVLRAWHRPTPGRLGQQDRVQGQVWLYRVPGQPGPHKTRLKKPNKPFLQDRQSLQSTFSSDFIPLPRGRKTHQDNIISTNTYNHTYPWAVLAAMYGNITTRTKALHRHPDPLQVLSESTVPSSLPHCLSPRHNRAKPQNQREVATLKQNQKYLISSFKIPLSPSLRSC